MDTLTSEESEVSSDKRNVATVSGRTDPTATYDLARKILDFGSSLHLIAECAISALVLTKYSTFMVKLSYLRGQVLRH